MMTNNSKLSTLFERQSAQHRAAALIANVFDSTDGDLTTVDLPLQHGPPHLIHPFPPFSLTPPPPSYAALHAGCTCPSQAAELPSQPIPLVSYRCGEVVAPTMALSAILTPPPNSTMMMVRASGH